MLKLNRQIIECESLPCGGAGGGGASPGAGGGAGAHPRDAVGGAAARGARHAVRAHQVPGGALHYFLS